MTALLIQSAHNGGDRSTPAARSTETPTSSSATIATTTATATVVRTITAEPTTQAQTQAPLPPKTYVVKPGDNLTVIAAWFHLHGYGALYERNKAVLGDDPDLIRPGERITISAGGMTTSS